MPILRIYTDGACSGNPGPGGWAAVLLLEEGHQEIAGFDSDTTNNRMELKAAIEGLKLAISLGYTKIHLYTDSAYITNPVLRGHIKKWASNGWKTTKGSEIKNKDLWVRMRNILLRHRGINFIKVKGHSGNKYNERVDFLARKQIVKEG